MDDSEDQVEAFKKAFTAADANADTFLDSDELAVFLKAPIVPDEGDEALLQEGEEASEGEEAEEGEEAQEGEEAEEGDETQEGEEAEEGEEAKEGKEEGEEEEDDEKEE